jgi:hypothetical protein
MPERSTFASVLDFKGYVVRHGWPNEPAISVIIRFDDGFKLLCLQGFASWSIAVELSEIEDFIANWLPNSGFRLNQELVKNQCGHLYGFWISVGLAPGSEILDEVVFGPSEGYYEMCRHFLGCEERDRKYEVVRQDEYGLE